MNEPGVTASAPGYGSPHAPVAIVGQSLCRKCMESGIPFTGGSGAYIDRVLEIAGREKRELFITNVVHCHPLDDRRSHPYEIENCLHFLHEELGVVEPRLSIGFGETRRRCSRLATPTRAACRGRSSTRNRRPGATYLLFP